MPDTQTQERDTWGGLFVLLLMCLSVILESVWLCVHGFIFLFLAFAIQSVEWKKGGHIEKQIAEHQVKLNK